MTDLVDDLQELLSNLKDVGDKAVILNRVRKRLQQLPKPTQLGVIFVYGNVAADTLTEFEKAPKGRVKKDLPALDKIQIESKDGQDNVTVAIPSRDSRFFISVTELNTTFKLQNSVENSFGFKASPLRSLVDHNGDGALWSNALPGFLRPPGISAASLDNLSMDNLSYVISQTKKAPAPEAAEGAAALTFVHDIDFNLRFQCSGLLAYLLKLQHASASLKIHSFDAPENPDDVLLDQKTASRTLTVNIQQKDRITTCHASQLKLKSKDFTITASIPDDKYADYTFTLAPEDAAGLTFNQLLKTYFNMGESAMGGFLDLGGTVGLKKFEVVVGRLKKPDLVQPAAGATATPAETDMAGLIANAKAGNLKVADVQAKLTVAGDKEGLEGAVWTAVKEALREAQPTDNLATLVTTAKKQLEAVAAVKKSAAGGEVTKAELKLAGTTLLETDEPDGGMAKITAAIKEAGDKVQTPIQLRDLVYDVFGWEVASILLTAGLTKEISLFGGKVVLKSADLELNILRPLAKQKPAAAASVAVVETKSETPPPPPPAAQKTGREISVTGNMTILFGDKPFTLKTLKENPGWITATLPGFTISDLIGNTNIAGIEFGSFGIPECHVSLRLQKAEAPDAGDEVAVDAGEKEPEVPAHFLMIANNELPQNASMRLGMADMDNWSFDGDSKDVPFLGAVAAFVPKFSIAAVTPVQRTGKATTEYSFSVYFDIQKIGSGVLDVIKKVGGPELSVDFKEPLLKADISYHDKKWAISLPWQQLLGLSASTKALTLPGLEKFPITIQKFEILPVDVEVSLAGDIQIKTENDIFFFDFRLFAAFTVSKTVLKGELGLSFGDKGLSLGKFLVMHSVGGTIDVGAGGGASGGIKITYSLQNLGSDGGGNGEFDVALNLVTGVPTRFVFKWPAKLSVPVLLKVFTNDHLRLPENTVFDECYLDQTVVKTSTAMTPITFKYDLMDMSFDVNASFNLLDTFSGYAIIKGSATAGWMEADMQLNPVDLFGIITVAGLDADGMHVDDSKPAKLAFKFDMKNPLSSFIIVDGGVRLGSWAEGTLRLRIGSLKDLFPDKTEIVRYYGETSPDAKILDFKANVRVLEFKAEASAFVKLDMRESEIAFKFELSGISKTLEKYLVQPFMDLCDKAKRQSDAFTARMEEKKKDLNKIDLEIERLNKENEKRKEGYEAQRKKAEQDYQNEMKLVAELEEKIEAEKVKLKQEYKEAAKNIRKAEKKLLVARQNVQRYKDELAEKEKEEDEARARGEAKRDSAQRALRRAENWFDDAQREVGRLQGVIDGCDRRIRNFEYERSNEYWFWNKAGYSIKIGWEYTKRTAVVATYWVASGALRTARLGVEAARRAYDGLKYVLDKAGLLALKGLLEAAKAAMSIAEKAVAGLGDVAENFAENFDPNFDPRVILLKTKKIGMIAVAKGFELARKGAASFLEGLSDFGNTAQGALLYAKKKICQVGLDLLIAGSKAYSWTLDQAAKVVKGLVLDIFQLDTVRFQAQLSKSQVGVVEFYVSGKLFQKPFAVEFRCDLREGLLGIAKALVAVCPFAQNVDQANAGLKQQITQERDQQRSQLQAARANLERKQELTVASTRLSQSMLTDQDTEETTRVLTEKIEGLDAECEAYDTLVSEQRQQREAEQSAQTKAVAAEIEKIKPDLDKIDKNEKAEVDRMNEENQAEIDKMNAENQAKIDKMDQSNKDEIARLTQANQLKIRKMNRENQKRIEDLNKENAAKRRELAKVIDQMNQRNKEKNQEQERQNHEKIRQMNEANKKKLAEMEARNQATIKRMHEKNLEVIAQLDAMNHGFTIEQDKRNKAVIDLQNDVNRKVTIAANDRLNKLKITMLDNMNAASRVDPHSAKTRSLLAERRKVFAKNGRFPVYQWFVSNKLNDVEERRRNHMQALLTPAEWNDLEEICKQFGNGFADNPFTIALQAAKKEQLAWSKYVQKKQLEICSAKDQQKVIDLIGSLKADMSTVDNSDAVFDELYNLMN